MAELPPTPQNPHDSERRRVMGLGYCLSVNDFLRVNPSVFFRILKGRKPCPIVTIF